MVDSRRGLVAGGLVEGLVEVDFGAVAPGAIPLVEAGLGSRGHGSRGEERRRGP